MKEEFLHYLFREKNLGNTFTTADNKTLEIVDFGQHNENAGPDFLEAKIRLDNKIWSGHIEFHLSASDWYKHGHQNDPKYKNVIAHFVLQNDQEVKSGDYVLPVVELRNKVSSADYERYRKLIERKAWIPCQKSLRDVSSEAIQKQKARAIEQRLKRKASKILSDIRELNGDRKKAFYLSLGRVMGGKVNADAFENLLHRIRLKDFAKFSRDSNEYEAFILGMAGLLPESSPNPYVKSLIETFNFQKHLLELAPMENISWKYSRMRPFSFPDVRLAQFAALLKNELNIQELCNADPDHCYKLLDIKMDPFWTKHFRLLNSTKEKSYSLSKNFKELIFINCLFPFIYAMDEYENSNNYKSIAINKLKVLKAENNNTIRQWKKIGMDIQSAHDTQALLEQKTKYCNEKKCLICSIGKEVLSA